MMRAGALLFLVGALLAPASAQAGYTHYWTWLQKPDAQAVTACVAEMGKLVQARKDLLDVRSPSADAGTAFLMFNGVGEGAHETFDFPGQPGFNFTKTAWKPYDDVVTAALLVARDHFPPEVLQIESDGAWEEGAWAKGAALYSEVTGRPARNPMDHDDAADQGGTPRVKDKRWFMVLGLGLLALWVLKSLG